MKINISLNGDMALLQNEEMENIKNFKFEILEKTIKPLEVDYEADDNMIRIKILMNTGDDLEYFYFNKTETCFLKINNEQSKIDTIVTWNLPINEIHSQYKKFIKSKIFRK